MENNDLEKFLSKEVGKIDMDQLKSVVKDADVIVKNWKESADERDVDYHYKFLQFMLNKPITIMRSGHGEGKQYFPPEFKLLLGEFAKNGKEMLNEFRKTYNI